MPPCWRTSLAWCRGLVLAGSLLLVGVQGTSSPGADAPAGSTAAIQAAFQANLKTVRDWLNDKDFASAEETTRGLTSLAHLYAQYSADADWRKRCSELQAATVSLADAAKRKSAVDCDKAALRCGGLLEDLAKNQPKWADKPPSDFKPLGAVKTWMVLMDGGYVDAKSAKTPHDLALVLHGIAAEANATAYLHVDATWRKDSFAVRDTALQIAGQTDKGDLPALRKSLKEIYNRCEACHDRSRKK
jgi:hypothetical protein